MKKHILTIVFAIFCAVAVFAETKITVTQSIRYGNGQFAVMDSPQVSIEKAHKEGGKVFFRYDFEITDKGFFDANTLYIFLRFPSDYMYFTVYSLKVTALSGAADLRHDVQKTFYGSNYYSEIGNSIERLPKANHWILRQRNLEKESKEYKYAEMDQCIAIPLKMINKSGNKAYIEFYIDFEELVRFYYDNVQKSYDEKAISWFENLLHEIPIDITFHTSYDTAISYHIPNAKHIEEVGYNLFWINVDHYDRWLHDCEASNRSFTIMVKD